MDPVNGAITAGYTSPLDPRSQILGVALTAATITASI
jgi:hypothetical protein